VVDTTAAGDGFNAGLVFQLGRGPDLEEALRFANVVAAMSTERLGAQTAMPSVQEALLRYDSATLIKRNIGLS
jgi:ribokinase